MLNTHKTPRGQRLATLALVLPLLGLTTQAQVTVTNGLVAYWSFDGNFYDSIKNFHGTPRGTAPIAFVDGKGGLGKAIKLNGDDQFVEITGGDENELEFPGGSMSIAGWFKVDAFDTTWQALVAKGEGTNWRVHRNNATDSMGHAGGVGEGPAGGSVNDGNWHHFVAMSDAAAVNFGTALYIDGVEDSVNASAPVLASNAQRVMIGENPDARSREWEGLIDELAIWKRVLTASEIATLYANGAGKPLSSFLPPPSGGTVKIDQQPASTSAVEGSSATFSVAASATGSFPPYYQWRKNGTDIAGAVGASYTTPTLAIADSGAKYSVKATVPGAEVISADAILTVTVDSTPPVILAAKGNPNRTEVTLAFSERLNPATVTSAANYKISSASGSLNVTAASLSADATKVTLTTAQQTVGTKYTVTVTNVKDASAGQNLIVPNSKTAFFPTGKIVEQKGFIVFEAENYDRNLDDLWVKDTTRGAPSGGVSMVVLNGTGAGENASKLEYDVEFKQAATYVIWYRASGNDGSDDSAWFHIDGARPAERANANDAAMTGFSGALDFVWRADSFDGVDPMSVDIAAPGAHVVGLAQRENGSFFDKFVLTTDTAYAPTGLGPPETREGSPAPPTVTLTGPTDGQKFPTGANITLTATASGAAGVDMARVEFSANAAVVGQATQSPFTFTWSNVKEGSYTLRAIATDEVGGVTTSAPVLIKVGTPPPSILFVTADPGPLTFAGDIAVYARLQKRGFDVELARGSDVPADGSTALGKNLIIQSSSLGSGTVENNGVGKFRTLAIPAMVWEASSQDAFAFQEANGTTSADQTQINIADSASPLAAGLPKGLVTVSTAEPYSQGTPEGAHIVATLAGDPTQAVIYNYDKGEKGFNGFVMPERRVFFFFGDNTASVATADGLKLFDAAVDWLLGGVTVKPPAPTLSVARTSTGLTLTFTGTLQSASAVTGPWADEANAKSPLAVTPASGQRFYRAKP